MCCEDTVAIACKQNVVTKSHQSWTNKFKTISSLDSHRTVFGQNTHKYARPAHTQFSIFWFSEVTEPIQEKSRTKSQWFCRQFAT